MSPSPSTIKISSPPRPSRSSTAAPPAGTTCSSPSPGALEALPRGEIDWDLGTEIRMNSVEEQPRVFKEHMDVSQGKLAIGWRLGECMEEPDMAKLRVFNAVYGGSVTSKLFTNVREKRSLCYYASSGVDIQKGLLLVSSAVNFENFGAAREEILAQLEAMRRGEITPTSSRAQGSAAPRPSAPWRTTPLPSRATGSP